MPAVKPPLSSVPPTIQSFLSDSGVGLLLETRKHWVEGESYPKGLKQQEKLILRAQREAEGPSSQKESPTESLEISSLENETSVEELYGVG